MELEIMVSGKRQTPIPRDIHNKIWPKPGSEPLFEVKCNSH